MPYYDYKCEQCDHRFEAFQSMGDAPLTDCPQCQTKALRKVFGAASGIIFKGSGFYVTDSKKSTCANGGCGAACQG